MMMTITYPIDVPVYHTAIRECVLRIESPLEAVLMAQDCGFNRAMDARAEEASRSSYDEATRERIAANYRSRRVPEVIRPQDTLSGVKSYDVSACTYIHGADDYAYTDAEQAAIDEYVVSTTVASQKRLISFGDYFHGGASVHRGPQLIEIERRLGRQVVRNV